MTLSRGPLIREAKVGFRRVPVKGSPSYFLGFLARASTK